MEGTRDGYCMHCRATVRPTNVRQVTMKNGKPATDGQCPACGTSIYQLGGLKLKS